MRKQFLFLAMLSLVTLVTLSCSSDKDESINESQNPFDTMTMSSNSDREKIVVVSDIHLGGDLSYSETVKHLSRLEQFLTEVRKSDTVKELVIAGDLLDEWYVPTRTDTYSGGSQLAFVKKIASSNRVVMDVLKGIIADGKIKLTYVPGNHDMLIDAATVESVLPGINQARDNNRTLLGTYETGSPIKIAVEHGHRYDFFCNLDPFSNAAIAPGSVLPPGYFFARIAANSFVNQVAKSQATPVRAVALNNKTLQQQAFFLYYYGWKYSLDNVIWVNDNFDEKIFKMNLNGFTGTFSMNDLLPFNDESGNITAKMYADAFSQESWEKRLAYNNVPMMTNVADAVIGSLKTDFIDKQADVQYFKNSHKQDVRIVVFGHTHIPMLKTFTNLNGEACIYANSGTWVDKKVRTESSTAVDQDEQSMDFVVITPREDDKSKIYVGLFQYNHGKHLLVDSQSIK